MFKLLFFGVFFAISVNGFNHGQQLADFEAYVTKFNKNNSYANTSARTLANYFFIFNRNQISHHNGQADRNQTSYRVAINQFTDFRLIQFVALLPKAIYTIAPQYYPPMSTQDAVDEYDIISDLNMTVKVEDQGTNCSSSWAYATAKAIEIMNGIQSVNLSPASLSAQELIDCAGMGTGCTTQVPQTAFDFLIQTPLTDVTNYPNNITLKNQGMCLSGNIMPMVQLMSYATITDGDDAALKRYISINIPVVIEYNPATFGFMEYSSGVYVPSKKTKSIGSQFLVVVGYGHDATSGLDYWRCLNSFGTTWGEMGYIRIVRSIKYPITNHAIFPNLL